MKNQKILLTRSVFFKGKQFLPDTVHDWPEDIVDELIDKNAGEPVMDVTGTQQEQGPYVPDPDLQPALLDAARQALARGEVVKSGAPSVSAMEEVLQTDISAEDRDWAWDVLLNEFENPSAESSGE